MTRSLAAGASSRALSMRSAAASSSSFAVRWRALIGSAWSLVLARKMSSMKACTACAVRASVCAMRLCACARCACWIDTALAPSTTTVIATAVATAARLRATNLRSRYPALSARASTGWPANQRCRSSAMALTVAYRSAGAFFSALPTMVFRSVAQSRGQAAALMRAGSSCSTACSVARRVARVKGRSPASSSWASTPSAQTSMAMLITPPPSCSGAA